MASTQYKVSVALDIGGSSTGYAIKEFDRSSADVLYPKWDAGEAKKTKSSILFTPEKEFAAFWTWGGTEDGRSNQERRGQEVVLLW